MRTQIQLFRGDVFYFLLSPKADWKNYRYILDGALIVHQKRIVDAGPFDEMKKRYGESAEMIDYTGRLIMPGLIDAHIHYPQSEVLGMYGCRLLDWLEGYTFPAEQEFVFPEQAEKIARFFVSELFRNGTTACMAYSTVHACSASTLFSVASEWDMCLLTGKVLMDRNAPDGLTDTAETGIDDSRQLIEAWHGKGRNRYVITPRFAITSSFEQLLKAGALHKEYPDTYIQTHLSENKEEIASTLDLFQDCSDYLEVYERAGLVTDHTVFGHCIHLSPSELERLAQAGSIIAHCPTSNLFLGSGLFDMHQADRTNVHNVLATDVGGGTSFSMWRTMGEAYKVQQLNGYSVSALELLYKCTLGTAIALQIDHETGTFEKGRFADFIVLDDAATPAQQLRKEYLMRNDKWTLENKLFGLQITGDDRNIAATYVAGNKVYEK